MMFMSHAMLLCENPAGHPDWPTGTGSKPAASSKLCWGARVEMHSKEPRDGSFVFSNHSMYFAVCAERLHAPMIHKPSHLCLQPGAASKTQGLVGCDSNHVFMIRCCWAHVEQLGHCRSVSFQSPSLQSFESADGRKLPKQRATVVTVAIVCVWIWDWAWDTCFVAVCGSYEIYPVFMNWSIEIPVLQRPMTGAAGACRICGTLLVRTDSLKD